MLTDTQVCVLGSGIAGALTSCLLHDAGFDVILIDRSGAAMTAASRWNEGKIHLGFTYTGTPVLATARLMIAGASEFEPVLEAVTGSTLPPEWWTVPVIYLVDDHSIFPASVLWPRVQATASLLAECAASHPSLQRHLGDGPLLTRLPIDDAMQATAQEHVAAAWRTAERAVAPGPVAERVRNAVAARALTLLAGTVTGVAAAAGGWEVTLATGFTVTAAAVVNCLWESRRMIDRMVRPAPGPITIRYKVAIFASGALGWEAIVPSTRILGKYGDITPYGNSDLYLSWYPVGLIASSDDGVPPALPAFDQGVLRQGMIAGLGLTSTLARSLIETSTIGGGFVVADGSGDISQPASSLHERTHPGARELAPGYISVDTGKYSLGPLMARRAADLVSRIITSR